MITKANATEIWLDFERWERGACEHGSGLTREQMTGAAVLFSWLKTRANQGTALDRVPDSATLGFGTVSAPEPTE